MNTIKTKYEQFVNKKKRRLTRRPLRKSGRLTRYKVPVAVYLYAVSFGISAIIFQNGFKRARITFKP